MLFPKDFAPTSDPLDSSGTPDKFGLWTSGGMQEKGRKNTQPYGSFSFAASIEGIYLSIYLVFLLLPL